MIGVAKAQLREAVRKTNQDMIDERTRKWKAEAPEHLQKYTDQLSTVALAPGLMIIEFGDDARYQITEETYTVCGLTTDLVYHETTLFHPDFCHDTLNEFFPAMQYVRARCTEVRSNLHHVTGSQRQGHRTTH